MKVMWDDIKNYGQVDGVSFSDKPSFSFSFDWLLVTNITAQFRVVGGNSNTLMSEAQLNEVINFYQNFEVPIPIEPTYTFDELKAQKLSELNSFFNSQYRAYLSQYPEIEQDSFKDKAQESALVVDDATVPLTSTYYLTKLAKADLAMLGNTTPTEAEIITVRNAIAVAVDEKADFVSATERQAVALRDMIKAIVVENFASEEEAITALDAISW